MRALQIVALIVIVALVGVTRLWPAVTRVEVIGQGHLSRTDVMRLADVAPGDPLLWISRWSVRGLQREPWVVQARITRHWPDTVAIAVVERVPVISDGATGWAADGTPLSGAAPAALADQVVADLRARIGEDCGLFRIVCAEDWRKLEEPDK